MIALAKALLFEEEFTRLVNGIDSGRCPAVLSGIGNIHKAHAAAALRVNTGRPVVIICADEVEAERYAADMEALIEEPAFLLTSREFAFYNAEGVSRQHEQRRLNTLFAMAERRAAVIVATADGFLQRTMPPERLTASALRLKTGESYSIEEIAEKLVLCGYSRCEQVEGPGQFAVRGGILDFFSPAQDAAVRCEFFGDELDSMRFFDVLSQSSTENVEETDILPAAETLAGDYSGEHGDREEGLANALIHLSQELARRKGTKPELIKNLASDIERLQNRRVFSTADRYMELIYPMATAADYIPEDAIIVMCEPLRVTERVKNYVWRLGEDSTSLLEAGVLEAGLVRFVEDWESFCQRLEHFPVVMADSFMGSRYPLNPHAILNIVAKQLPSYGGNLETATGDIEHYVGAGYKTVVLCQDRRRAGIMQEHLMQHGLSASLDYDLKSMPENGVCTVAVGSLSAGMEYPNIKLAVITEKTVESTPNRPKKRKQVSNREKIDNYADLSPGDLIVHEQHGVGRYEGLFKLPVDGVEKDYIKIAYAGTDSLYVPATQLDLVAKYIGGGEEKTVKLSKMGGADWSRVKTRAKAAAKEMARELVALYAERQRVKGHAFAPDSVWQTEFEEAFAYQETDDQLRCTEEIKSDMQTPVPMDRLLCGDVGYGKTEVALRAVMKCILDGHQAAILVPTTVLAQQHYVTAMRRFAGYPVNIEVLSRFRTSAQMKKAVCEIESGAVDLVIGTHRLLQKDIKFNKLGLLIVDEEQRFGVSHKERLKEMSRRVDVLTLSATPIPRTLNMALSGIRDMSTIEEPPRDRQPVQTYVMEYDWNVLTDALRREVSRGGQAYFLHNRVENINRVAARISEELDGVSVAVAHGKMDEESLSDVMERMASGEVQVLVCTTIIETGLDIPNVNTLIIEDADRLGLAQLHQIRGRVGRSPRRAFAYLTFRRGKILTEVAEKRLSAIREFVEFNSGFKIAMRDLEIRGAGNLLGAEQSGHMISVGYDMYLKLLEEAVLEERGEKPEKRADCSADIAVSANLPEKYIPSGEQRIDIYRRIAKIRTEEDSDEIIGELIDRYGDPPTEVIALVSIAILRGEAARAGISEISQKAGWLRLKLTDFEMERISALYNLSEYKGRVKVEAGTDPVIALRLRSGKVLDEAMKFIRAYSTVL